MDLQTHTSLNELSASLLHWALLTLFCIQGFATKCVFEWASPMAESVKNLPAMQETQVMRVQFLGQEDSLEKGMASHSSILSRKIPRTEVSGRLLFMGSQESDMAERLSLHTQPFIITMFILL